MMKVSKLKANPSNPRVIKDEKFKKLVKSLQEFPEMMEKRPMVCVTDVDGRIYPLGGNMRLRAIQELGMKEIPNAWVMMADDWTEDKRREFTIKDNVGFGEWEWDQLANEWDAELLVDWGLDVWQQAEQDQELEVGEVKEEDVKAPTGSDDDYSVFELVMLYSSKQRIFTAINLAKKKHGYEGNEEALMHIIENYLQNEQ